MNQSPNTSSNQARFELGQLCYTPGAQSALEQYQVSPLDLITRHVNGDWGEVCPDDAEANEDALRTGARLLSAFVLSPPEGSDLSTSVKIWVITEADRSVTTLLLPEEY